MRKQASNVVRLWGVTYTNRQTQVLPDSIRETREAAIRAFVEPRKPVAGQTDWRFAWSEWRKRGCRAVRVVVTVPPTNTGGAE